MSSRTKYLSPPERFELIVRLDELKAIERKRREPHILLCFNPEETLDYFRRTGYQAKRLAEIEATGDGSRADAP